MSGACDLFIALLLNDSPVPEDMKKSVSQGEGALYTAKITLDKTFKLVIL